MEIKNKLMIFLIKKEMNDFRNYQLTKNYRKKNKSNVDKNI